MQVVYGAGPLAGLVLCLSATAAVAAPVVGVVSTKAAQATRAPLVFYGVSLKTATRTSLNAALKRTGLPVVTKGPEDWFDTYRMNGQVRGLQGASMLAVRFTKDDRFAIAQYTFPSFEDIHEVQDIMGMVRYKYGEPTVIEGDIHHGPVVARWKEPGGTEIKVWRGWPSTTTYMDFENVGNFKRMLAEMPAALRKKGAISGLAPPVAGKSQWEPPAPSDLTTPGVNKAIPMSLEVAIIMFFSVPALIIVAFAHFLSRVTRVPPSFRVVVRVTLGRMANWFRRPAWRKR